MTLTYNQVKPELHKLSREEQYMLLLNCIEWQNFRQKVLLRDKQKCTRCGAEQGVKNIPLDETQEVERENQVVEATKRHIEMFAELFDLGKQDVRLDYSKLYREYSNMYPRYSTRTITLQVHHKYYILNRLPWEYQITALTTVCKDCHISIHSLEQIKMYVDDTLTRIYNYAQTCVKCCGQGYIDKYSYVRSGVCFECGGMGVHLKMP